MLKNVVSLQINGRKTTNSWKNVVSLREKNRMTTLERSDDAAGGLWQVVDFFRSLGIRQAAHPGNLMDIRAETETDLPH